MGLVDWWRRFRKATQPPYDRNDLEVVGDFDSPPPSEGDEKVLAELVRLGADLTRSRHTIHFLYFPNKSEAQSAATALAANGFIARSEPKSIIPSKNQWPVIAEQMATVNSQTMTVTRSFLTRLAEQYNGEYDGWEASLD